MSKYIFIILIVLAILFIRIYYENRVFKLTSYELKSDKLNGLKEDIRIVVLADLHNHVYGKENDTLIRAIEKVKPDLILVAGDLIVAKPGSEMETAISLLKNLADKYEIYYGIGNHEYRLKIYPEQYGDMYEKYIGELTKANIHIMDNKCKRIKIKDTILNIYGIEIEKEYYKRFVTTKMTVQYIKSLIGNSNEKEYNILIAHNPKYFKTYAKWGADLILSGHIHGGLVSLPFLGGVASPQVEFFPEYDAGLFEENDKRMILSRGLGTHTINVRLNNQAELIHVVLKRSK